jgi:hypothetical protein
MTGDSSRSDLNRSGCGGEVARLRPLRVLVISPDRHFLTVTAMLIARRGCVIFTMADAADLAELIGGEGIDVVVVDGDPADVERSAEDASAAGFAPAAAVVAVGEDACEPSLGRLTVAKWGPFERLFAAIEYAELHRGAFLGPDAVIWPSPTREAGEPG